MLTTPSFLADLIERVLSVSQKLNSNAAVKMLLASAKNKYDVDDAAEQAKSALLKFQVSMYDLEDLFADPAATEFLIVTIVIEGGEKRFLLQVVPMPSAPRRTI